MDTNQQARALMMRHHKWIKNRQQSMLERTAEEIGMDIKGSDYNGTIQGKPHSSFRISYDRSKVSLS
jgi:predicted metal-dependent hydrolase